MTFQSLLQQYRLKYSPPLPRILQNLKLLEPVADSSIFFTTSSTIQEQFLHTAQQPLLSFKAEGHFSANALKVGVVFSGGQAPGGNNVISGLFDALKKLDPHSQLIGFLDGPSGIIKNKFLSLTEEKIASYRNQGGFDLIGSGRTKIETEEQFEAAEQTFKVQQLDGLVIIGGDDSNTNAAFLAEFCRKKGVETRIIGVPKTIDGDLKNTFIETSFGFDTACKIYSEIIGNLAKDALSAKKYYFFVKMMGRSSSHVTLECAMQTRVNLALIGEEIATQQQSLMDVVKQIADLVQERANQEKNYGVILIPEGLLEFTLDCHVLIEELNKLLADASFAKEMKQTNFSSLVERIRSQLTSIARACFENLTQDIQQQFLLDRDAHGNVQLSKIETERLLIALVEEELNCRKAIGQYKGEFNPQPIFCGYEGRSGLPSNFDCQYCYALGHLAALLIHHGASGYMCCLTNLTESIDTWEIWGIPIVSMLHFEWRKNKKQAVLQKALVDLKGPVFNAFKEKRGQWRLEDSYCCPGPMQFEGPKELTDGYSLTLRYEKHGL